MRSETGVSRKSDRSKSANRGGLSNAVSMASLFEEKETVKKVVHPFDNIVGEKVNNLIQENTGGQVIGLTFAQFKEIPWPNIYPNFICDVIETISGFSMQQELADRLSKKQDEDRSIQVTNMIKQEKEQMLITNKQEKVMREKLEISLLSAKEKKLAEMRLMITGMVYDDLFRFFDFCKHNVNEKNQSKCYMTEASLQLNLKKYFGHRTPFLDERFYIALT